MINELATENVNKLLWKFSIPAILGMLSGAIFNVVDRIFVGRISELSLTAVGITMPIQIFQMAFILLIGIGSSALISIKLGENKRHEAEDILFLSLKYITIILAIIAFFFYFFCDDILKILNVSQNVYEMAREYILVIMIGSVISIPGYCLNNSMRAIGKTDISMKIILISSVINIILDPIFIFTFDLGVMGAAIATVISQLSLTVYVIYYFVKNKDISVNLKFQKIPLHKEFKYLKEILISGSPSFYVQILATFVGTFINYQILKYGTDFDIAAVLVASTIFGFYHMIIYGVVHGNQPICGYNFGAKRFDRVRLSLKLSLFYVFLISMFLSLFVIFFPEILARPFLESDAHLEKTVFVLRWYLSMIPLVGLHTISSQYFISVGKSGLSSLLSMLRYGIILVPCVLILAPIYGVNGIFVSYALSDLLSSVVGIFFIIKELIELKGKENEKSII